MSISLILMPLSIAFGSTITATTAVSTAAVAAGMVGSKGVLALAAEAHLRHLKHLKKLYEESQQEEIPPIETIFNDATLLEKTLREHGLKVSVMSENELVCQLDEIQLRYSRQSNNEPFVLHITGIEDVKKLFEEIELFEQEYKQNVQSYTYNTLVENLAENNMEITEETVLDDNSIMLTIDF